MITNTALNNEETFENVRLLSNRLRFKIVELTQDEEMSISELSSILKLAYTRCSDYVAMLESHNLVIKTKEGKNVSVKSKVKISKNKVEF